LNADAPGSAAIPPANWQRECIAVIPCYNEAARIGQVVAAVKRHLPEVLVIDDGSSDDTAHYAKNSGAKTLQLAKKSGKGAALRAGWARARKLGFTWVLMLDGDGQHAAGDIPSFFDCAEKTGAKLIVGNRMENCEAMPWPRRTVNRWMSQRLAKLTGVPLPDSQCGFRLAHLETLLRLPITASHFEIESEMLVAYAAAGNQIKFIPVQTVYKTGASKIHPVTDTWRWFRWRLAQRKPKQPEILLAPVVAPETLSAD
jgi:glycosyltransferase involved in cell wall biosynthesis